MVFIAYAPAMRAGFIWDDDKYVTENPMLTAPDGLRQIWFSAHTQSQYFPLVYTTFRFERALWGLNPAGYHLVNILLHGLNAALVWVLLRRLKIPGAWLAAAVFALHPVQVESVAWVAELKNLESWFFSLLALLAWLKVLDSWTVQSDYLVAGQTGNTSQKNSLGLEEVPRNTTPHIETYRAAGRNWWVFYALALVAYLLALFAKTTACTLPAALLLVVWLRKEKLTWGRAGLVVPFVLLGVGMGLVSIWWEGNLGTYEEGMQLSFTWLQRMLIAARAFWFYIGKLILPVHLSFSYPRWEIQVRNAAQYIPVAGCGALAVALWVWRRRLGTGVIVGVLFFAATLAPLLGFISNYTFQYSFVADHYQYVASLGLIAIAAASLTKWSAASRQSRLLGRAGAGVVLIVLAVLTSMKCRAYSDIQTLWRDTIAQNPTSWMAHHNLAVELHTQGKLEEAGEHYLAAIALNPRHVMARNNLGLILAGQDRISEAIEQYQAALAAEPDFAQTYNNLALALWRRGDLQGAETNLQRALQLQPKMLGPTLNLADLYKEEGNTNTALKTLQNAVAELPAEPEAWRHLAAMLLGSKRFDEAIAAYRNAVKAAPTRTDLLTELGGALAAETNYAEALRVYQQALKADPNSATAHYGLGVVLGRQGQKAQEIEELKVALKLHPDYTEAVQELLRASIQSDR
jgi:Tfp pilus assembly protein PilF